MANVNLRKGGMFFGASRLVACNKQLQSPSPANWHNQLRTRTCMKYRGTKNRTAMMAAGATACSEALLAECAKHGPATHATLKYLCQAEAGAYSTKGTKKPMQVAPLACTLQATRVTRVLVCWCSNSIYRRLLQQKQRPQVQRGGAAWPPPQVRSGRASLPGWPRKSRYSWCGCYATINPVFMEGIRVIRPNGASAASEQNRLSRCLPSIGAGQGILTCRSLHRVCVQHRA